MSPCYNPLTPEEIRLHKGKSFPGVAVTFLCHNGQGDFFMTQRSAGSRDEAGTWDVGGGGLKFGETTAAGAIREAREEYGALILGEPQLLGHREVFRAAPDGTPTHWLTFDYILRVDPATVAIREPEMLSDSGWFTLDHLPAPRHSQMVTRYWELHEPKLRQHLRPTNALAREATWPPQR